jgi:hypothetical protein
MEKAMTPFITGIIRPDIGGYMRASVQTGD